jgi:guanylate cyclase
MRDMQHNNVNKFIGASVSAGSMLLISQYATKGSLQDVLENLEIKLDTLFILSLIYDIVKGMIYLHSSELKCHGNLKSSNCVIDSRWVLKITDFGLKEIRSKNTSEDQFNMNSLLWTAPEHLRDQAAVGTQKGDVYSYGIILQVNRIIEFLQVFLGISRFS